MVPAKGYNFEAAAVDGGSAGRAGIADGFAAAIDHGRDAIAQVADGCTAAGLDRGCSKHGTSAADGQVAAALDGCAGCLAGIGNVRGAAVHDRGIDR